MLWHCWLGDWKGIQPVKSWVWVCWWWRFDWSFARLVTPVVTTTSIILSSINIQNGDILVPADQVVLEWPLNECWFCCLLMSVCLFPCKTILCKLQCSVHFLQAMDSDVGKCAKPEKITFHHVGLLNLWGLFCQTVWALQNLALFLLTLQQVHLTTVASRDQDGCIYVIYQKSWTSLEMANDCH